MKTFAAFIIVLLAIPAQASVFHSVGIARSTDNGEVRYIEHHQYFDDGRHLIRYFDRSLNLIAYKDLSYGDSKLRPQIRQKNLITDTEILVRPNDNAVEQVVIQGDTREEFTVPLKETTVIDAGFDAYIRSAWDQLVVNGKPTFFDFAIAGRDITIPMRVKPIPANTAGLEGKTGFVVEPKNWLVRQLVPEIRLQYNGQKRLARYEGFSNIAPTAGQSRTVAITFQHYSLDKRLEQPLSDWLSSIPSELTSG